MKLKKSPLARRKFISKLLLLGIVFNAIPINSYAGILSEDTRYETFEGSKIKINDIREETQVDVEIEGNTLVNILNYKDLYINNYWTYKDGVGYMKLADKTDTFKAILYPLNKEIEINKEYTLFINITKNTMQRYDDENGAIAKISLAKDVGDDNMFFIYPSQTGVIKYVFRPTEIINNKPYITMMPNSYNGEFEYKDFMIIEGNHIDKDISFFEGMKSVGQNDKNGHEIEILSSNDTLLIDNEELKVKGELYFTKGWWAIKINKDVNRVKIVVKNKDGLTRNCKLGIKNDIESEENLVYLFDMNTPFDIIERDYDLKGSNTLSFCTYGTNTMNDDFLDYYDIKVYSYDNMHDLASSVKHNKKEMQLNEPLRSLPNGVKDRIVKKDNNWYVERNCGEIVFDGSEDWRIDTGYNSGTHIRFKTSISNLRYGDAGIYVTSDKFVSASSNSWRDSSEQVDNDSKGLNINILKTKLSIPNVDGFKEWLSKNSTTVVYQLAEPIYEPLNINLSVNLYLDTTYITTNSIIPANLKVIVDRVLNRAMDYTEIALNSQNIEDLSNARYWTNLLSESIKKDELQSQLNSLTDLDNMQMEKKKVSANADIYIVPRNTLSMSLNTNSIVFDDVDSTEDFEMKNALEISVESSLPYELTANLPVEIYNSDKSSVLDKNLLNIKCSTDNDYKTFSKLNEKIVLVENDADYSNKKYNIDFKISGGTAYKADIYKAVIEFEATQK